MSKPQILEFLAEEQAALGQCVSAADLSVGEGSCWGAGQTNCCVNSARIRDTEISPGNGGQ